MVKQKEKGFALKGHCTWSLSNKFSFLLYTGATDWFVAKVKLSNRVGKILHDEWLFTMFSFILKCTNEVHKLKDKDKKTEDPAVAIN